MGKMGAERVKGRERERERKGEVRTVVVGRVREANGQEALAKLLVRYQKCELRVATVCQRSGSGRWMWML